MPSQLMLLSAGPLAALPVSVQQEIYQEFYELVYGIIYYMVWDHGATEDLIQESFLKVVLNAPPIEEEAKLRSWIKTVVRNSVYSFLRKNKRRFGEMNVDSAVTNQHLHAYAQLAASVEQQIEFKLMSETVERALVELKPEHQALLEMRWKQELSYKEMACLLNTSEETVKHKLHRARTAMRKRLDKLWGEPKQASRSRRPQTSGLGIQAGKW
ncbi:sigma-70 family RNA polymerase sigma factor [Cohnella lubricantis]|uniref:Sigma-70 family RNA polymerase sigma factor n=1 Tax=Cohnella lubricantis TaxID=2163172 RepID=A0A841TER4_9BACL|nr:sigma-70 family RNA polymerase sigma factor [Cohnella lubricantis]MBB6678565.1 sigma-70 family RNA polymerase sigma factor [Cohnella lubricantis]MBP2119126.1 RNA polymerase sigma-70 factor (ECF subfamily) [Cohnella lubricantis]